MAGSHEKSSEGERIAPRASKTRLSSPLDHHHGPGFVKLEPVLNEAVGDFIVYFDPMKIIKALLRCHLIFGQY